VVDRELAVVGTANLDNRSFRLNFEVIAAIYDRGVSSDLATLFEQDLSRSSLIEPHPQSGRLTHRLLVNVARLFAPVL
jgi:cardiolipin synthase A/B